MIPTSIDGTDITGATIDGTDVQEITVDGQTVFTAVEEPPNTATLWLDASQESFSNNQAVTTWTDQLGNGDFTSDSVAGDPTFETNEVNGKPALFFEDDILAGSRSGVREVWAVYKIPDVTDNNDGKLMNLIGDIRNGRVIRTEVNGISEWRGEGGSVDNDDWATTEVEINGINTVSIQENAYEIGRFVGNAQTLSDIGYNRRTADRYFTGYIAEFLIHDSVLTSTQIANEETRLGNKYNITI